MTAMRSLSFTRSSEASRISVRPDATGLAKALSEQEDTARSLRDRITNLESANSESLARASELESRCKESSSQLDSALSERLELEAKLSSASDERTSLLERCLGAESEVERSRSSVLELRRKLDDSQAALHELGRENQSIQVRSGKFMVPEKGKGHRFVVELDLFAGPFFL